MDFFPIYQMTKNLFHLMTFINSIFAILEEMASGGSKKLCLVVVVWPEGKKIFENRICFGDSNALGFLGNRISFLFEGLFSFSSSASSKIFLSVACSIEKK